MGPVGIRLGLIKNWNSVWYADSKDYSSNLKIDIIVRNYLYKKLSSALIGRIKIERPSQNAKVIIYTARPGIVIGKKGEDVEILRFELTKKMGVPVQINIEEIKRPELNARLVSENICHQLKKRVMF